MRTLAYEETAILPSFVRQPTTFERINNKELLEALRYCLGKDEAGYFIMDKYGNCGIVEGTSFQELRTLHGNKPLTIQNVCEMWQKDTLKHFIDIFGYENIIVKTMSDIGRIVLSLKENYRKYEE